MLFNSQKILFRGKCLNYEFLWKLEDLADINNTPDETNISIMAPNNNCNDQTFQLTKFRLPS